MTTVMGRPSSTAVQSEAYQRMDTKNETRLEPVEAPVGIAGYLRKTARIISVDCHHQDALVDRQAGRQVGRQEGRGRTPTL